MAQKEKLQFILNGKKMAYEGYPDHRERDLFDLLMKMKVPQDQICEAYRKNMPDSPYTDSDIFSRLEAAKAAKEAKKKAKEAAKTGDAPPEETKAPPPETKPVPPKSAQSPPPQATTVAPVQHQVPPGLEDPEYRDSLTNFIESVVKTDRQSVLDRMAGGAHREAPPAQQQSPAVAQPSQEYNPVHDRRASTVDPEEMQHAAATGKMMVFLQAEGADSNKAISVPQGASFDDFSMLVEKKFGCPMAMSFYDGEDRIDLDDDDTLDMFIHVMSSGNKRFKVQCAKRKAVREDRMTTVTETTRDSASAERSAEEAPSKGEVTTAATSTFTGHGGAIYCCGFAPNSDRFISASRDKTVRIWNLTDGTNTQMKGGHPEMVLSCDFSPDAEHVVSSSVDPTIKLWKASTCQKYMTMKGHTDKVYCTRFNDTGKYIASASCDRSIRIWSAVKGAQLAKLEGHTLMVFSCDFSRTDNGKLVASASEDRLVKIWDWEKGTEVRSLLSHTGPVWSCRFSHDDKYMVSASMDNEVKIWDLAVGKPLKTFTGHKCPVHDATFSADGKYVFSCGRDYKILKWPVETPEAQTPVVEEFTGHTDIIYHIDYNAQKNQLLSCSLDQTVKLWTCATK